MKYIKSKQAIQFTAEQVTDIVGKIEAGRLTRGFKTNAAHVQHVKTILESKSESKLVAEPAEPAELVECVDKSCPKCSSEMMLREAKKGHNFGQQFWGCSRFPKCRNILKVTP